mgnify:CR=1 FL=1
MYFFDSLKNLPVIGALAKLAFSPNMLGILDAVFPGPPVIDSYTYFILSGDISILLSASFLDIPIANLPEGVSFVLLKYCNDSGLNLSKSD